MDVEQWVPMLDFGLYEISTHGRVRNVESGHVLSIFANNMDMACVGLFRGHAQHQRTVAKLVAEHFLAEELVDAFDTPINLDGDRMNNRVDNLVIRPRWFAVKYHRQFKSRSRRHIPWPIQERDTGEIFNNTWDCAKQRGYLEKDLVTGILMDVPVWPYAKSYDVLPH